MPRIILPALDIPITRKLKITGESVHYLINVLRLKIDDEFQILDTNGNLYKAKIIASARRFIDAKIIASETINTESPLYFIYVQAILKGEKMDFLIQKATELGVKEIYPVITSRTIVKHTEKHKRWQKIAHESVRQCGRSHPPLIHEPITFKSFLESLNEPVNGYIFYECAEASLKRVSLDRKENTPLYAITGPEGGFTSAEIDSAVSKGLFPVRLGPRILRAETAAITALGLIQFLFGDID